MKPQCIAKVAQAAGRALTQAEINGIDARMDEAMRRLARQDPQGWMGKSVDQRVLEAATLAMKDMQAQAKRKADNAQRQIVKTVEVQNQIDRFQQLYNAGRNRGLVEFLNTVNNYSEGIKKQYTSGLMDLIEAAKSGEGATAGRKVLQFLFDAENPQMSRDLALEVFSNASGSTGNKIAQQGAKAWLETINSMRQRFNSAGGDVGQLDYGYLPQPHDTARIRQVGADAWAQKTLPKLDRSRYLREDGSRMNDAEVLDFLKAAHETLATDGLNKTQPGQFKGTGARSNRGSDHRALHFKDGESYLAYNAEFGVGSMYDAMVAHIGGMSKNIALVERMGPNPAHQFRLQDDLAMRADNGHKRVFGNTPQSYWDIISGTTGAPESARLAEVGQHIRNIQTFGKLAGAVVSSLTDIATIVTTTGYNKLPYWDLLKNTMTAGGEDAKAFANAHGMMAESMVHDLNRWQGEHIANNWSGRLANITMKLSLMNAWTDTLRRGFSMTMMAGLGKLSKIDWGKLSDWDRTHLERKGISEADWKVVNTAQLDNYRGQDMLTPDSIKATNDPAASEVISKVLGLITDESEYAVINPDLATRAIQTWGGTQAGTVKGELARAVMQFKSFPIAMISRHWRRMLDAPQGLDGSPALANKAAYTAAMLLTTTALGAVVFQTKQMMQGKDPVDMTNPKFWTRAVAQGGGAGFIGDLIMGDTTQDRSSLDTFGRLFMGPTFGSMADLWDLTKGNIDEALAGKETHAGAEAVKFTRSHVPYVNLWYGRAAFDHLVMHSIQENLSTGYLERMKARAYTDWDQQYWWQPGEAMPSRAPNMNAIGGR